MSWDAMEGVEFYMLGFSRDEPLAPSADAIDLPGTGTHFSSDPLEDGEWYFVLAPVERNAASVTVAVSCGPYVIEH